MMMRRRSPRVDQFPPFPTPRTDEVHARGPETLRYTHPPRTPRLLAAQHLGWCDTRIRERGERCGHGDAIGLRIVAQVPGGDSDGGTFIQMRVIGRRHLASKFFACAAGKGGMGVTTFGVLGREGGSWGLGGWVESGR